MYVKPFAALAIAALSLPAIAESTNDATETKSSEHKFTGALTLASQYVFRGLSQTDGKPALQGGVDYSHASGFYLGTWASNISWYTDQNAGVKSAPVSLASPGSVGAPYVAGRSNAANLEWDFYGGFKKEFGDGWNYDVGLIRYYYPGRFENIGAYRQPNTTEVYAGLGYKWVTVKYSKAMSTYTFGVDESKGASYLDLSAVVPVGDSGFSVLAHAGRQDYPGNPNVGYWGASGGNNDFFDYRDYKLGITKDYAGYTFALAWTYADTKDAAPDGDTTAYMNAFGKNIGRERVALTVTRSF